MSTTTYTFENVKSLAVDSLKQGIIGLLLSQPLTEVTSLGDQLFLTFAGELSGPEQDDLTALVETHDGVPLPPKPPEVTLSSPKTEDGKPVIDIYPGTEGFKTWITGHGDSITEGRGEGQPMIVAFTSEEARGTKQINIEFNEPVEIHDGQVTWKPVTNWTHEDKFSVGLTIPASTATENLTGTGNCNKVALGPGVHTYVPAAGNGGYDLTSACPVPAKDNPGYWDVDYNTGAVTPCPTPGKGKYNLFDFPINAYIVKNICCNHPMGVFDIDVYKVEYFHPKWKLVWSCTKNSPGEGVLSAWVFCFRRETT